MKSDRLIALASAMLVGGSMIMAQALRQAPMQLRYQQPAEAWDEEALPLGNGWMAAMVFGGVESERIQINEGSLWSGGPGEVENYNGGHIGTPQSHHENLLRAQKLLQEESAEWSRTKAPYFDESGKLVTADFHNSQEIRRLSNGHRGSPKGPGGFGSFQTVGDLVINDLNYPQPLIDQNSIQTNRSGSGDENIKKLFDGTGRTKYYAGEGNGNGDYEISWAYKTPVDFSSYTIVSGNDAPERDPRVWKLYVSADGKKYREVHSVDSPDASPWGDARRKPVTFSLGKTYPAVKYFKWVVSRTGGGELQAAEFNCNPAVALPAYTGYSRMLDIDNAVHTVAYDLDGAHYTREVFMSYPDHVLVARLTTTDPDGFNISLGLPTPHVKAVVSADPKARTLTLEGYPVATLPQNVEGFDKGMHFAMRAKVDTDGGTVTADGSDLVVKGAHTVTILLSAATNYRMCQDDTFDFFDGRNPLDKVDSYLAAASKKSVDALRSAHIDDYHSLYNRNSIMLGELTLPDMTTLELLDKVDTGEADDAARRYLETLYYQFGRYLLISASRPGTMPANLQGHWADGLHPAWDADYHTNINVQMNYWLSGPTNLIECQQPLLEYICTLAPRGYITAQHYYCRPDGGKVRGWTTGHECNIWGNTAPGNSDASFFPSSSAWLCQHFWNQYEFSHDKALLEKYWPVILDAALFNVDFLSRDNRDSTLVMSPSWSPEHGPYTMGCSTMQAMTWDIFTIALRAAAILGKEQLPEVAEIRDALSQLSGPEIGLGGQWKEWKEETTTDITGDHHHRHTNHLYWMHPADIIVPGRSAQDDTFAEAAKVTLNTRGDESTGWSMAWKMNFWARLHDGDRARKVFSRALHHTSPRHGRNEGGVFSNLFDAHPPFQIDGNYGATAGVAEMLLQSHGGLIQPLAALPTGWADGAFKGMMARGNFEIDAAWKNGRITEMTVRSHSGQDCKIKYPGIGSRKVSGAKVTRIDDDTIVFPTQAGKVYTIR